MLRAIVIDDEASAVETLKILAGRNAQTVKIVASSQDPKKGIELVEDYRPDVVFLDISMPGMDGFELLDQLSYRDFVLVFITAHREHAIQAIKNRAFDYILKPVAADEFRKCVEKIAAGRKLAAVTAHAGTIEVQVKDGIIYVKQKDIIRLEASRSYCIFYLDNGIKHVASKSLREFEDRLDPEVFYRCHNSHLVNLHKVRKFVNREGFFALMSDGSLPDISKSNKDVFLERLKNI